MQEAIEAIADPRRREILRLIRSEERPAAAIAAHFADVSRPAISQHLRVLREAGYLSERRDCTRRLYYMRGELVEVSSHTGGWEAMLARLAEAARGGDR